MTATAMPTAAAEPLPLRRPTVGTRISRLVLPVFTGVAVVYLFLPIAVMIAFSFNDPAGRQNITWQGFTLRNYVDLWGRPDITGPMVNSLIVAVVATLISTVLGTLIGMALTRYDFRGRTGLNLLIFIPMATPEIIMGASLLSLFVSAGTGLGPVTITIAHVMFSISFVAVVVRSRVLTLDRSIEEAAYDLGATAWTTFWKVTFPMILPGIMAAALLAFSLSIDDYVITAFTAGRTSTFPIFIWGSARVGVPVQVNVIGTAFFLIAVGFVALTTILGSRARRPLPPPTLGDERLEREPARTTLAEVEA